MHILNNKIYLDEIRLISSHDLPWNVLSGQTLLVSGASGMLGSLLIDIIMFKNLHENLNCKIIAIARNKSKLSSRFKYYLKSPLFDYIETDITKPILIDDVDYIFHFASNTHPVQYATQPISTILTNVNGTKNLLDVSVKNKCKNFIFASTVEIYGQSYSESGSFNENSLGYIDCNTLRAGYPESKRVAEALCQAYHTQHKLSFKVCRFPRLFGPTVLANDTKAINQFIFNAVKGENIVLKSDGKQKFSFMYVIDAILAMLYIFFYGKNTEAYNISDKSFDLTLKDLAQKIAAFSGNNVVYMKPNTVEQSGFSKSTWAVMDNIKLSDLGWNVTNNIDVALQKTIKILRNII